MKEKTLTLLSIIFCYTLTGFIFILLTFMAIIFLPFSILGKIISSIGRFIEDLINRGEQHMTSFIESKPVQIYFKFIEFCLGPSPRESGLTNSASKIKEKR